MPKRTDIKSILIIGAGPIVIGQACGSDYSGVQACKALQPRCPPHRAGQFDSGKPVGSRPIPNLASATYIEPITPEIVGWGVAEEHPDALLPTIGSQTALNTALALEKSGVLARYGVEMIGAKADVIEKAEDRQKFRDAMDKHRPGKSPLARRPHGGGGAGRSGVRWPARDHPPELYPGRHRRRHRLQRGRVSRDRRTRPRRQPGLAKCSSRNRCWAGRNMRWRWSAT